MRSSLGIDEDPLAVCDLLNGPPWNDPNCSRGVSRGPNMAYLSSLISVGGIISSILIISSGELASNNFVLILSFSSSKILKSLPLFNNDIFCFILACSFGSFTDASIAISTILYISSL